MIEKLTPRESSFEPNRFALNTDKTWLFSLQHNGEQLVERQRENVRRLAGAWNFTRNITVEQIEELVARQDAAITANAQDKKLEAEKKALLAPIDPERLTQRKCNGDNTYGPWTEASEDTLKWLADISAANQERLLSGKSIFLSRVFGMLQEEVKLKDGAA